MRTTFFAGLALTTSMLAACGGESPPPQPPPPPPPVAMASAAAPAEPPPPAPPAPPPKPALGEVIPQAIKGINEAIAAHDDAREYGYLADDVVFHFYGSLVGDEMHGKAELKERFKKAPFDAKALPDRVWIKGNVAVVEYTWAGKSTADAKDPKMANRPFGQKRAVVYVFDENGLVREERLYADVLALKAQMKGDSKAPALEPLPTAAPEVHVGKGTPDEDKLVDWAKKVDDAFNTGDVKQPIAFLADDVEYDAWGVPPLKGKKENEKDLRSFFKAFPDQKWTPANVMGIDGTVVIEHVFTGTQKAPYGRFTKVTGKPVTGEHYLEFWQPNADGKLAHGWAYANPVEALLETGVMKKGEEQPATTPAASK